MFGVESPTDGPSRRRWMVGGKNPAAATTRAPRDGARTRASAGRIAPRRRRATPHASARDARGLREAEERASGARVAPHARLHPSALNPKLLLAMFFAPVARAGSAVVRTVELDDALASLAVDHRNGGLLATESLDLGMEDRRRGAEASAGWTGTAAASREKKI